MKIALFVHCFFPEHFYGTETYTLEVARNLRALGHEPLVISAVFFGEPLREGLVSRYDYDQIPVYCIDKNKMPHRRIRETYYQPEMSDVLRDILLEIRPDLAHVNHLGNHTAALLDVLKEMSIPTVATLTDFFGFCFTNRLEAADGSLCNGPNRTRTNCIACTLKEVGLNHPEILRYRFLANHYIASLCAKILRYVHAGRFTKEIVDDLVDRPNILAQRYTYYRAVIAPTRFLASAYIANGLQVPIHHMHFGIDMPQVPKKSVAPNAPLKFGFIGQLAPHKGTDILIEAFRRLPKGAAELDIYGSGKPGDEYANDLIQLAEGFSVDFRGTFPNERIAEVFATLDFLVIPSRWYENSPLVLLGALASHTPVVASDVEGMAEFVEHGNNGFLFERGSVDALEQIMQTLTQDPARARTLTANTDYRRSTREMTEDLVSIYNSIIEAQ
jgi:glycosyltransferase involved in cell wall biosynthesis